MLEKLINEIEKTPGKKIVSIVGAGGKTSLMYALASIYASKKQKTLVTTTTHIWKPQDELIAKNMRELWGLWGQNRYAVVGEFVKNGKLKALSAEKLESFMQDAEVVLIEADGAKGLPCKVPNNKEPVIIKESNIVIMVLGLDCLGEQLQEVCFRSELAMELLHLDKKDTMKEGDLVNIIRNQLEPEQELRNKRCMVVLNKCDDEKRRKQGEIIEKELKKYGKYKVYFTTFK